MGLRTGGLLLVGAAALGGCAAHVALPRAPPRDAPYAARARTYHAFRPIGIQYTTIVSHDRYGGTTTSTSATGLLLANGLRVVHPEDLLPLAGERSAMAHDAREWVRVQRIAAPLGVSGLVATALGAGLVFAGILANFGSSSSGSAGGALLLAGGALVLTGSIPLFVGVGLGAAASRHRESAYAMYEGSLRQNLGLCDDATEFGACATAGEPSGPPRRQPLPLPQQPQPQLPRSQPQQPQQPADVNVVPPILITP